jgi:outer membrane protein assembly factor BamB
MNRLWITGEMAVLAAAFALLIVGPPDASAARPSQGTPAVAYQLNPAHSGAVPDRLAKRVRRRWSVDLGGPISYPLIVDGRVYVTVGHTDSYGSKLYALDVATGATVWGPIELGGTYFWSGLAYDGGRVFTVNGDGLMGAFDAASGAATWSLQLPGQYAFSSPPTAIGGRVYTGGAGWGGTVYAVDASTAAVEWTASVANGDNSSPAVSSSGVHVSYACGQAYRFSPRSGALLWHRATGCSGGGGTTPLLAGGRLYVRDFSFPAVLDAARAPSWDRF